MKPVRLKSDLQRPDGAVFRQGTILYVSREYPVDQGRETRLCLCYSSGSIVLPCCDPKTVEAVD